MEDKEISENIIQRTFIPGDEWLYIKIYSGPKTSDTILTNVIKPVIIQLFSLKLIDKWFFIRYSDPKMHLRIRFHLANTDYLNSVIQLIRLSMKSYIESDLVWKIQIDTYHREIERYGENTIDIVENLFYYDSNMMLNFTGSLNGDEGESLRWLFGIKAIDVILNDFKMELHTKYEFISKMKDNYFKEFGINHNIKIALDKKFRGENNKIMEILFNNNNASKYYYFEKILLERSLNGKADIKRLLELENNKELKVDYDGLLSGIIHMMINRLFRSKQRMQEMVLYYFLYKYYSSKAARNKNKSNNEKE